MPAAFVVFGFDLACYFVHGGWWELQAMFVYDRAKDEIVARTTKYLGGGGSARWLYRDKSPESHFYKLGPFGETMLLNCHDMAALSGRGLKNAEDPEYQGLQASPLQAAEDAKPEMLLHIGHTLGAPSNWRAEPSGGGEHAGVSELVLPRRRDQPREAAHQRERVQVDPALSRTRGASEAQPHALLLDELEPCGREGRAHHIAAQPRAARRVLGGDTNGRMHLEARFGRSRDGTEEAGGLARRLAPPAVLRLGLGGDSSRKPRRESHRVKRSSTRASRARSVLGAGPGSSTKSSVSPSPST